MLISWEVTSWSKPGVFRGRQERKRRLGTYEEAFGYQLRAAHRSKQPRQDVGASAGLALLCPVRVMSLHEMTPRVVKVEGGSGM